MDGCPIIGIFRSCSSANTWGNLILISFIVSNGSSPDKFALVVANAPVWRKIDRATLQSGTRKPIVEFWSGFITAGISFDAGNTNVKAPGKY